MQSEHPAGDWAMTIGAACDLPPMERLVLFILAGQLDLTGRCDLPTRRIARLAGIPPELATHCLGRLIGRNLIGRVPGGWQLHTAPKGPDDAR